MDIDRRRVLVLPGALALGEAGAQPPATGKVLRIAFPIAETGFDPPQLSDLYSRTITPHIFESLYCYDHLARPVKLQPLTAAAMPEIAEEYRSFTIRLRPGIFFADDPAFGGKKRELVAEDYVYSFKRFADPAVKSPQWSAVEDFGISGLADLRQQSISGKKPFDYGREIEGLQTLDRYTLRFRLDQTGPRFVENLALADLFGAVAREVVQFYGDKIMEHPVGTGPFRLAAWRRSSRIVLERNPSYRRRLWYAEPAAGDAQGQAIAAKLAGKAIPMIDRVEVSIVEESQPRWLAFLNGQLDAVAVPGDFVNIAMPGGKIAPHLAKRGIRGRRTLQPDSVLSLFNMEDPVVGGLSPERVALRRAICLSFDIQREIQTVRRGQAMPAQSIIVPHTTGYDSAFKSEMSDYNPARAKALLDLYGYVDRNGDGWREQPDGSPLVIKYATQTSQDSRQLNELWKKNWDAIGVRFEFSIAKWPENLKAARAGKLQMWGVGSLAANTDGQQALQRLYGPQSGLANLARFKLPAFDMLYEKMLRLPDGTERDSLFEQAKRMMVAYAPYKTHCHRFAVDLEQPWLIGRRRPLFWQEWWHMVDVDPGLRPSDA
jgi:ABC-type transport system substrate-binding protein